MGSSIILLVGLILFWSNSLLHVLFLLHVPFFCENRLVSSLHEVVAQNGRIALRLGCFRNWCHLENQEGRLLEILLADCNLMMLLLIDFKFDEVEGQKTVIF